MKGENTMKIRHFTHSLLNFCKKGNKMNAQNTSSAYPEPIDKHPNDLYDNCIHGLIPVENLIYFSKSNNTMNRSDVARASNCPDFLLENLATDEEDIVRFCVAGNLNTPICILELLGTDKAYAVRSRVMTNPNCPVVLRNELMKDPDCEGLIAEIPNLTEEEIRKYFNMDYHTKEVMCFLQKIPDDIIQQILSENDNRLIQNLKNNKQLKGHPLLS